MHPTGSGEIKIDVDEYKSSLTMSPRICSVFIAQLRVVEARIRFGGPLISQPLRRSGRRKVAASGSIRGTKGDGK